MMFKSKFFIVFLIVYTCIALNQWPNHKISSLRLLQVVHRHGDRAPTERYFPPNDPYKREIYWPSGYTELTAQGRQRMFRLGQFIRQQYNAYLGDKYSVREIYARSSQTDRCIESVYCLIAGAYPPLHYDSFWMDSSEKNSKLGLIWQPIAVETLMPRSNDSVLNMKSCPICDLELSRILRSDKVRRFFIDNLEFYGQLSGVVGSPITTISEAHHLHDILSIETNNGYFWSHVWSESEQKSFVNRLYDSHLMSYSIGWDRPVFKRLRAGGLLRELMTNIDKVVNNTNDKKLFVYSTHDIIIVALLHALNVFNSINSIPPFGTSLLFELHHKTDDSNINRTNHKRINEFSVKIYYFNETLIGSPYALQIPDCDKRIECPLNAFLAFIQKYFYEDFDKECKTLDIDLRNEENSQIID